MNMADHTAEPVPHLPHDIFHVHILPDILSDQLHKLLVEATVPDWHAFHTLPLVSFAFHNTCRVLFAHIFGLQDNEGGSAINNILGYAQSLWCQAKQSPQTSRPLPQYTYRELMSGSSLIQVYICTALARSFLNLDVLRPVVLQGRGMDICGHNDNWRDYAEEQSMVSQDLTNIPGPRLCDDTMHRVYLPLTCAITLCDSVRPERLADIAAKYLAEILPAYSTAPVLLKYSQDLETYVARVHRVDIETWANWTLQTLSLIETTRELLQQVQDMGKLVRSFSQTSAIPLEVLEATNIIEAVRAVVGASWGSHTQEIRARALSILQEWKATQ